VQDGAVLAVNVLEWVGGAIQAIFIIWVILRLGKKHTEMEIKRQLPPLIKVVITRTKLDPVDQYPISSSTREFDV
jgi:hypothetical protein